MSPYYEKTWLILLLLTLVFLLSFIPRVFALEEFSLSSKLNLSGTPMPCSLTDEIQLDAPCEETFIKWDVKSIVDLDFKIGKTDYFLDSALSIAHPEHLVLGLESSMGELTVKPEIWFAVPFQSAIDVSNLYNSVVIPPGDPLFFTARFNTTFNFSGIRFKNLFMYEDINFPSARSNYGDITYDYQSQDFKVGNIFYFSGRTESGLSYASRTSFCASSSTRVKNYSASGGVKAACNNEINERFSLRGIKIGGLRINETINANIGDDTTLTSRTGLGFSLFDWSRITTSFTADIIKAEVDKSPFALGLSFSSAPCSLNVRFSELQELKFSSTTGSFHQRFGLGPINGAFSANATVQDERGLTGVSMSLFVSQGTVSTSSSVSFSKRNDKFKFSYLNNRINLRLSPFTFTASPAFGEDGLRRLAMSIGVMF